jgi:RNase P subunit RPR2
MKSRCGNCGAFCSMGINAVSRHRHNTKEKVMLCDRCAGIERDHQGRTWEPGETEQTVLDDDKLVTIRRK